MSAKNVWIYAAKTLPILASVAVSFSAFSLQTYDTPYLAHLFTPEVTTPPDFLGYTPKELPRLPQSSVDSLFHEFIRSNFPDFMLKQEIAITTLYFGSTVS